MTRMKSIALTASLLLGTGLATGLTAQPAFAQRGNDTIPGTDSGYIQPTRFGDLSGEQIPEAPRFGDLSGEQIPEAPRFGDLSGEQIPEAPRWGDLSGEQTPEAPRANQGS